MSRKSELQPASKGFLTAGRGCVRGVYADENYNVPGDCMNGAFNVDTAEGKVARVASIAPH